MLLADARSLRGAFVVLCFTESFAQTREYETLMELGYVAMRYSERNPYGVRHEPWHIKINHRI